MGFFFYLVDVVNFLILLRIYSVLLIVGWEDEDGEEEKVYFKNKNVNNIIWFLNYIIFWVWKY